MLLPAFDPYVFADPIVIHGQNGRVFAEGMAGPFVGQKDAAEVGMPGEGYAK